MKLDPKLKEELKVYVAQKLHNKTPRVEVISPYRLDSEDIEVLKKNIPALSNAEIENTIDNNIIAGVVIKFGSKMIDLSINGELQHIKNMMANI